MLAKMHKITKGDFSVLYSVLFLTSGITTWKTKTDNHSHLHGQFRKLCSQSYEVVFIFFFFSYSFHIRVL